MDNNNNFGNGNGNMQNSSYGYTPDPSNANNSYTSGYGQSNGYTPNSYGQPQADFSQSAYSQNSYTSNTGSAPGYQQPMGNSYNMQDLETPMTVGEWALTLVLCFIPCVNLIMLFIWAFGKSENQSKTNWAKAMLIIVGVVTVLYMIAVTLWGAAFASYMNRAMMP